jgi:hypothetical protein
MVYSVVVADNFHYMDPDEIYTLGEYSDAGAALEAARRIVNEYLESVYREGMSAGELWGSYQCFGEDPVIVAHGEDKVEFSGWGCARERCAQMCQAA